MPKWYCTFTRHDWPEGGSYGIIVEAPNSLAAEDLASVEMRQTYSEQYDVTDLATLDDLNHEWHLVDCFDLDQFIERHKK